MNKKVKYIIGLVIGFTVSVGFAQNNIQTVYKSDFTIRDIAMVKESLFFIKKRDLFIYDPKTKELHNRFIGGYGLEFVNNTSNWEGVITVSNELVENVSSIRFFKTLKEKPDYVFYNYEGKILDYVDIPEQKLFAISLISSKIIFIDYSEKPKFTKSIEIDLEAPARKILYNGNYLYFATDLGEIYEYDLNTYSKKKLIADSTLITNFIIRDRQLWYSTVDGYLKSSDFDQQNEAVFKINDSFAVTFIDDNENLICGTWDGRVVILKKDNLKVKSNQQVHKQSILKIIKHDDIFYSCSVDGTIKKWNY